VFPIEPTPKTLDEPKEALSRFDKKDKAVDASPSLEVVAKELGNAPKAFGAQDEKTTSDVAEIIHRDPSKAASTAIGRPEFHESLSISGYRRGHHEVPHTHLNAINMFAKDANTAQSVAVIGLTDKVGSPAANAAIARARAIRVEQELLRQGVSSAKVTAQRDWGTRIRKQILISTFDNCNGLLDEFAKYLGLSKPVIRAMQKKMSDRYSGGFDWNRLSLVDMLAISKVRTLLIHDTMDAEIPFQHSVNLLTAGSHVSLHATHDLGQHKILGGVDVLAKIIDFAKSRA
jgi:outer membrane protein OmpA-like peptidoglycan-associated protein